MDFFDYFFKLKKALKLTPSLAKEELFSIDYIGSLNDFINNKKVKKAFVIITISLFVIFICFLINMQLGKLDGPSVKNLKINNSAYGEITYSGAIKNRKIIGSGILTIVGNKWAVEFNGDFVENDSIDNSRNIQIGSFEKGSIKIVNLDSGNTYLLSGNFDNMQLKDGFIEKTFGDTIVKYTGSFNDYKLNGIGEKYVFINGQSVTFKGVFVDNKLKSGD